MKRIFCTFHFLSERATSYSTLRKIFSYAIYNVSKLLKYHISKIYVKTTLKVVLYKRWLYSNNSLNYRRRWRACKILATVCKKRFADTSKLSVINEFSRKNSTPPPPRWGYRFFWSSLPGFPLKFTMTIPLEFSIVLQWPLWPNCYPIQLNIPPLYWFA